LGWLIVYDPVRALGHVRDGLRNLAQKIVGPCALVQGALPSMLRNTPESFFEHTRQLLSANADIAMRVLSAAPGLRPVRPHGAMYITVCVRRGAFAGSFGSTYEKNDEMAMVKALISEQSVYCLPGSAFMYDDCFRLVLTFPADVTLDACERIREFCTQHYNNNDKTITKNSFLNGLINTSHR